MTRVKRDPAWYAAATRIYLLNAIGSFVIGWLWAAGRWYFYLLASLCAMAAVVSLACRSFLSSRQLHTATANGRRLRPEREVAAIAQPSNIKLITPQNVMLGIAAVLAVATVLTVMWLF